MNIKYEIIFNEYQSKYVVFITDEVNFNTKGIFSADTKKECSEWLKMHKKEVITNGKSQ